MKWIVAGVMMSALVGSTALAVPIATENFDYGPTTQNLGGLGTAADGWAGAWGSASDPGVPDYGATNLDLDAKYPSAQYDNSANVGGMAGVFSQVSSWYPTHREFAAPQTGTVWLSAILQYAGTGSDHVMLWLDQEASGLNVDMVGILNGQPYMVYRTGSYDDGAGTQTLGSGVYLLLAKVEMNYSGALDRVAMWIDPNLSSGEAGLGSPTVLRESGDALGSSLLGVGISLSDNAGGGLDAIRVGTTLTDVTSVPEPVSLAMLVLGGLPMMIRRRHA